MKVGVTDAAEEDFNLTSRGVGSRRGIVAEASVSWLVLRRLHFGRVHKFNFCIQMLKRLYLMVAVSHTGCSTCSDIAQKCHPTEATATTRFVRTLSGGWAIGIRCLPVSQMAIQTVLPPHPACGVSAAAIIAGGRPVSRGKRGEMAGLASDIQAMSTSSASFRGAVVWLRSSARSIGNVTGHAHGILEQTGEVKLAHSRLAQAVQIEVFGQCSASQVDICWSLKPAGKGCR